MDDPDAQRRRHTLIAASKAAVTVLFAMIGYALFALLAPVTPVERERAAAAPEPVVRPAETTAPGAPAPPSIEPTASEEEASLAKATAAPAPAETSPPPVETSPPPPPSPPPAFPRPVAPKPKSKLPYKEL